MAHYWPQPSTGFLAALQLADSFFPTGMYAHSHGLEGLIARGLVSTAGEVAEFLGNQLVWSVLPGDGVALLHAHRAAGAGDLESLIAIDRLLLALKLPQELRSASTQLGQRLMAETANLISPSLGVKRGPPPLPREELEGMRSANPQLPRATEENCHPGSPSIFAAYHDKVARKETPGNGAVALGVAAGALAIPPGQALLLFCHSHAVSVLGAALRLLPLTHTDAQVILQRLHPVITNMAGEIEDVPWQDMTSFTPELDIEAMRHEAHDLRLFAS